MYNGAYSTALRDALTEVKNICSDIKASFLFDKEGTVIAGDTKSLEMPFEKTINAMENLLDKTETIGGLDSLVINAQKGKVNVSCVSDMYLAMVTSQNVDTTYLQTVSRVLIPTLIKLLDNIAATPTSIKPLQSKPSFANLTRKTEQQEEAEETSDEETREEAIEEARARVTLSPERKPPQDLPEPSNQLVVDNLSGLLVRSDTVQIDAEILEQWSDYYGVDKINQVEIESSNGNKVVRKVKPIKGSKIEDKDTIRIPDKIRQDLDVNKGETVRVKPVMEEE